MGGLGSGGFNRKTKEEKRMTGTYRPDREKKGVTVSPLCEKEQKPPKGLSREARELWKTVCRGWYVDSASLVVLRQVCETLDRLRQTQAALEGQDLTFVNLKTGTSQANPLLRVERDCQATFIKLWRLLALDVEPPVGGNRQ